MSRFRNKKGQFVKKKSENPGCGGIIFTVIIIGGLIVFTKPLIGIAVMFVGFFMYYVNKRETEKLKQIQNTEEITTKETSDITSEFIMRQIEIMQDCLQIVNKSSNLQTSICRYYDLIDVMKKMSKFTENELKDAGVYSHDNFEEKLKELIDNKDGLFNGMIERAYAKILEEVDSLKTIDGKINKIKKFFETIKNNRELSAKNIEYIYKLEEEFDASKIQYEVNSLNDMDNTDEEYVIWQSDSPFDPYFDLSDKIRKEKDILKKLEYCEQSYEILPKYISLFIKEDNELPPSILCRDIGPELYMRLGEFDKAETAIRKCIAANAYYPDSGQSELDYLQSYKYISNKVLQFLRDNPGFLQKNIYKAMSSDEKIDIDYLKSFMRNSLQLRKEKHGTTNKLFVLDNIPKQ